MPDANPLLGTKPPGEEASSNDAKRFDTFCGKGETL